MSLSALHRILPSRLSRSFSTTCLCKNIPLESGKPSPPRRKGRTPKVNPDTHPLLPPQKLRALVSLYHQSDDFITPENLLDRIDAAFLNDATEHYKSVNRIRHEAYDKALESQRSAPRMRPWTVDGVNPSLYDGDASGGNSWSGTITGRERQIIEALYGVDSPRPNMQPLPGYETLIRH